MAITYQSGSVYADATGQLVLGRVKATHIIFAGVNSNDAFTIRDGDGAGDPIKLHAHVPSNYATLHLDFSTSPMVFQDGIYLSALSASCTITIILSSGNN